VAKTYSQLFATQTTVRKFLHSKNAADAADKLDTRNYATLRLLRQLIGASDGMFKGVFELVGKQRGLLRDGLGPPPAPLGAPPCRGGVPRGRGGPHPAPVQTSVSNINRAVRFCVSGPKNGVKVSVCNLSP